MVLLIMIIITIITVIIIIIIIIIIIREKNLYYKTSIKILFTINLPLQKI